MLGARVKALSEKLVTPELRHRFDAWWKGEPWAPGAAPETAGAGATRAEEVAPVASIAEQLWGPGFLTPSDALMAVDLASHHAPAKDQKIALLGAGLGGIATALLAAGEGSLDGYVFEPDHAASAQRRLKEANQHKRSSITVIDLEALSLPEASYATVASQHALSRARDKTQFLAQCAAALTAGGTLVAYDLGTPSGPLSSSECAALFGPEQDHMFPMAQGEAVAGLSAAGLTIEAKDDLTDAYVQAVTTGWSNLRRVLDRLGAEASAPETRNALLHVVAEEAALWANRLEALRSNRLEAYRISAAKR